MDLTQTPRSADYQARLEAFIAEHVDPVAELPDTDRRIVERLKAKAQAEDLWNLDVRHADYGPGLTSLEYAPIAEVLGTSRLAQEATNTDAPSSINGDESPFFDFSQMPLHWEVPEATPLEGFVA